MTYLQQVAEDQRLLQHLTLTVELQRRAFGKVRTTGGGLMSHAGPSIPRSSYSPSASYTRRTTPSYRASRTSMDLPCILRNETLVSTFTASASASSALDLAQHKYHRRLPCLFRTSSSTSGINTICFQSLVQDFVLLEGQP